jgi:translocation and assembly module TamB
VQLPDFTSLPLPQRQPLSGRIQASLADLGGLAAWIPELASSAGSLEADLRPTGTLEQPGLVGILSLSGGAADIPIAGLQLTGIELRATSNPEQPGELDINGGLTSGPGRVDLTGKLDLPGNSLALEISGERLQVYNTADARALLSPDLELGWSDDTLRLRGQLLIPQADITPKLGLSPAAIAEDPEATVAPGQVITPSPDIVVINDTWDRPTGGDEPDAPFRIDSQVQLVLGDEVAVNALGLTSMITGTVGFTNAPDSPDLLPIANGKLSLQNGTFRAFGQDLDIETGQLIFANVPVNEPELNIRAVRWIDNDPQVTAAGILITGAVTEPALELFSRPQMEASEIQSYLLTGRSAGDRDNVLSIGTYLQPKLYVGYGYNLLEGTSQFNSLFSVTPRYGMGASFGEADNNLNLTITHEH